MRRGYLMWAVALLLLTARCVRAETIQFASTPGLDQVQFAPSLFGADAASALLSIDDSAWAPAVACLPEPSWPWLSDSVEPYATWISDAYLPPEGSEAGDTWRWFQRVITLPVGSYGYSGSLTGCTADNAELVYVNGIPVGSDGEVFGPFFDEEEWRTILSYPIDGTFLYEGENELLILVRNYDSIGHLWTNPTGLIYEGGISYSVSIPAAIDIKPGSYPNSINPDHGGVIPVAILGSEIFDVTCVDPSTVVLAGASVQVRGTGKRYMSHYEDVNGDGITDVVVQISMDSLQLTGGCVEAVLDGYLYGDCGGHAFSGTDSVSIVPPA